MNDLEDFDALATTQESNNLYTSQESTEMVRNFQQTQKRMKETVRKYKEQCQVSENAKLEIMEDLAAQRKEYDSIVQMKDKLEIAYNE